MYGFGIRQFNFSPGDDLSPEEMAEAFLAYVSAEQYPHLHRVVWLAMESDYDAETDFTFGLELILDGLQRVLVRQERTSA